MARRADPAHAASERRPERTDAVAAPLRPAVTRSPGRPLEPAVRAALAPRLGGDFARIPVRSARTGERVARPDAAAERDAAAGAGDRTPPAPAAGGAPSAIAATLGAVRIHTGAEAAASARAHGARAYAHGDHLVFGAREYDPASPEGRTLLAHELTHVLQQRGLPDSARPVARAGLIETLARFFGGGTFGDEELTNYLTFLRDERRPEGDFDSDNKARAVVARWREGAAGFGALDVTTRVLLIREMLDGFLSGDDQQAILDLFDEAIASERIAIADDSGLEGHERRFDGERHEQLRRLLRDTEFERDTRAMEGPWTVSGVQEILHRHGDEHILRTIRDQGIRIIAFETAYDTWRYHDDGREEEVELERLRGNRDGDELRIRKSLTSEEAAATLFHETTHYTMTGLERREEEIQVRVETERFRVRHGLPPTHPRYRRADGEIDEAFIRDQILNSPHYSPTGRTRIGRRYEGEEEVTGWSLP